MFAEAEHVCRGEAIMVSAAVSCVQRGSWVSVGEFSIGSTSTVHFLGLKAKAQRCAQFLVVADRQGEKIYSGGPKDNREVGVFDAR